MSETMGGISVLLGLFALVGWLLWLLTERDDG
jgi:hypothetical protein